MKKHFLLSAICLVALLVSCKKKADPCEGKSCPANASCIDGTCVCGTDYYKIGDTCFKKDTSTFYYSSQTTCNCLPNNFLLQLITAGGSHSIQYIFPYGESFGSVSSGCNYFPSMTGDSIRAIQSYPTCNVKGKQAVMEFLGKIKNKEMKLKVRFFEPNDYSTTLDECNLVLKQ